MKKLLLILIASYALANAGIKVDDALKNNPFNLPLNAQNVANIKVAGVILVGTACCKGIMGLKQGTGHWHEINKNVREVSQAKMNQELAQIQDDAKKTKFVKKYQTNLNRLNRREKFDDAWFGFSRTLMVFAPLGLLAFLYN